MTKASPFSLARFEYEPAPLYYLPKKFNLLQELKPTYVIGSRGTGKTTLLNALNWEQQLTNEDLERQLGASFIERKYVGVYLRAPRFQCDKFEAWLSGQDSAIYAAIFSTYFDLAWLEVLASALAKLLARGTLLAPIQDEYSTTKLILSRFPELVVGISGPEDCSFMKFSDVVRRRREELEGLALWKSGSELSFLAQRYPLGHYGDFGRGAGAYFAEFCNRNTSVPEGGDGRSWHFKVCVDEAEYLSPFQRLVINTVVRLSSVPVSYVVAYVRVPDDPSATLLPNMSLQQADRDVVELDFMSDADFQELAEGAATVRIKHHLNGPIETFQTHSVLGELNVNRLLLAILSTSENPRAKSLLDRARAHAVSPFFRVQPADAPNNRAPIDFERDPPPIYQTYLVERLSLTIPSPDTPEWKRRAQDSAEIRKRMVAAYLCLCAELKQAVRYGSAEMLFQMSDKCVRDYLNQMNEIFVDFGAPLQEFLRSIIPQNKQDRALKAAATKKRDFLPQSGISSPREAAALVDGLAALTARLQATPESDTALRSSERGIFTLYLDSLPQDAKWLVRLISETAEAGYFKILSEEGKQIEFRVHCSLAAAYGFSYRGAYYKVGLAYRDLLAIIECKADRKERADVVAKLAQAIDKPTVGSFPLFES
ncbi:MAG: hypothetical protein WB992_05790 [Bryobacteraceae bacterium]